MKLPLNLDRIKCYNYITISLAFFPLLGLKKSVIAVILWSLFSLFLFLSQKSYKTIAKKELINVLILSSYYLSCIVSFFFIEDKKLAFSFLEKNIAFFIFPFFLIMNQRLIFKDTLRKTLYLFVLSNLVLAVYIWGVIFSKGFLTSMQMDTYYNPVIRNYFADLSEIHLPYLGILFVFSALLVLKELLSQKIKFNWELVAKSLTLGLLLFSVIAFAARLALMIFLIVSFYLVFKRASFFGKSIFLISIVALCFLMLSLPSSKKRIDEIIYTKMELPNKNQKSEEVNFRYGIYNCVNTVLKENWLFGVGPGNVQNELNKCYASYTYKNYDDYTNVEYNSHNQYLDIWLKYGIFGLIFFMFFLFWGIKCSNENYGIFLFIIVIAMLTENILNRQVGVIFFTFFNSLFFINRIDNFEKSTNK
jgi:O-antigen ligase